MKKKLTQGQQETLALMVANGQHSLSASHLDNLAHLVVSGYAEGDSVNYVKATTKGVRFAVREKLVSQHGTRFRLPEGSLLVEVRESIAQGNVRLTVIQPNKPRDPFAEGFDAAMSGNASSNPWEGQTERAEYDAGYTAGAEHRLQNPVRTA